MLEKLISCNYALDVKQLTLIDSHFGTEIFLLNTDTKKYVVKVLPIDCNADIETEGKVTEYLLSNGLQVTRLLKTLYGTYYIKAGATQFHIMEFVEGETLPLNSAPDWFLDTSASIIGQVHKTLAHYEDLKINFGNDFFCATTAINSLEHYSKILSETSQEADTALILQLEERIRHLKRISEFDIDTGKITYTNSHGDYHSGQIITNGKKLTVIDWTSACRLPAALEIIMAYVTTAPICKDGIINSDGLKKYINQYSKYFSLSDYDLKIMPYIFYFQQIICHYPPPYGNEPNAFYHAICKHINKFTGWLYDNTENLSTELLR